MTKADETLVRPFGPLGPWYRLTTRGLFLHRLSLAGIPLTLLVGGVLARSHRGGAEPAILIAGLVIVLCLGALASQNGRKTDERPPPPVKRQRPKK